MACPSIFSRLRSHTSRLSSCGSWNRTNASWFRARHHHQQQLPRIQHFLDTHDLKTFTQKVSCGSRTHLAGLEARSLCRSAKDTLKRKEATEDDCLVGSRPQGGRLKNASYRVLPSSSLIARRRHLLPSRLIARPLSRRLPSPIGLPFRLMKLRWKESNLHSSA